MQHYTDTKYTGFRGRPGFAKGQTMVKVEREHIMGVWGHSGVQGQSPWWGSGEAPEAKSLLSILVQNGAKS